MAAIPGTILAAKISPGDTIATFPTHEDIYGQGGLRTVTSFNDLTGIPITRQKAGMIVYVSDTGTYYSLSSLSYPLTSFTTSFSFGNGGNVFLPLSGGEVVGFVSFSDISASSVSTPFYSSRSIRVDGQVTTTFDDFNTVIGGGFGPFYETAPDIIGDRNTVVGYNAALPLSTGQYNSYFGVDAGRYTVTGTGNTGIGNESLGSQLMDGNNNTAIGRGAGTYLGSGSNNVFVGYLASANTSSAPISGSIVIGSEASAGGYNNAVVIGRNAQARKNSDLVIGSVTYPVSGDLYGSLNITNNLSVNGNITTTGTLSGSNLVADTLTVPVSVTNLTNSKIFSGTDSNKIFHFNTTSQSLSAIFPSTLPNGFSVAVMNTGTGVLELSAGSLKSISNIIADQYGGAFVYKQNNDIFAVGRL